MKSLGTDTTTAGFPLVIPTQTQQPTARLTLKNDLGQVVQQWLVKQNKCTLGSAASCSLRCNLPGIAPYHALLVVGARQIFIRALAPKLSRDGRALNEILLTDDSSHFEIAGHRFELSRTSANSSHDLEEASAQNISPGRLKFTLARPFELSQRKTSARSDSTEPSPSPLATTAANAQPGTDAKWVAQLVQAAIQPIECQLHNLLEPLAELQVESRKQKRLRRKRKIAKRQQAENTDEPVSLPTFDESTAQRLIEQSQAETSRHIEAIVVKHSTAMDVLTERISDVNHQLSAIERIIATEREESKEEPADNPQINQQLDLQSTAIEQLQNGIVSVTTALQELQSRQSQEQAESSTWKSFVQEQLSVLSQVIDGLADRVADVHQSTAQLTNRLENPPPPAPVENGLGIIPADAIANQVIAAIQGQISTLAHNQPIHDSVEEVHWQHAIGEATIEEFHVSDADYPAAGSAPSPEFQNVVVDNSVVRYSVVNPKPSAPSHIGSPASQTEVDSAQNSTANEPTATEDCDASVSEALVEPPMPATPMAESNTPTAQPIADQQNQNASQPPVAESSDQLWESDAALSETTPSNGFDSLSNEDLQFADTDSVENAYDDSSDSNSSESHEFPAPVSSMDSLLDTPEDPPIEMHALDATEVEQSLAEPLQAEPVPVEPWIEHESPKSELGEPAQESLAAKTADDIANSQPEEEIFETLGTLEAAALPDEILAEDVPSGMNLLVQQPDLNEEDDIPADQEFLYGSESLGTPPATDTEEEEWPTFTAPISDTAIKPSTDDELPIWEQPNANANPIQEHPSSEHSFADESFSVPVQEPTLQQEQDEDTVDGLPSWWIEDDATNQGDSGSQSAGPLIDRAEIDMPAAASNSLAADEELLHGLSDAINESSSTSAAAEQIDDSVASEASPPAQPQMLLPAQEVDDLELELQPMDFATDDPSESARQAADLAESQEQATEAAGDASVEDYMRKLLARMRGVPEDEVELPESPRPVSSPQPQAPKPQAAAESPAVAQPAAHLTERQTVGTTEALTAEPTEPFDPEKYMPRALAPERSRNLAAMRELANSSARTAIHKSTRQRHLSSILLKVAIATIGLTVGTVLIVINGFNLNIGLIATVASFLVAAIWGYDAASSIKPLLQAELVLRPHETLSAAKAKQATADAEHAEAAEAQLEAAGQGEHEDAASPASPKTEA